MVQSQIKKSIQQAVQSLGIEISVSDIHLEHPAEESHGDYSSNIALKIAGKRGQGGESREYKNPRELADLIVKSLEQPLSPLAPLNPLAPIKKIEIAGPGFINFWLSHEYLINQLSSEYNATISDIGKGKKVVVEYSSPNIAKPFTIGHLRSTIIGDAISNLLQATGWDVYRDNHVGDWGTQFGKQIYSIKTWGDEASIDKSERPVKELVALYVRFHKEAEKDPSLEDNAREWFKKLEEGDTEARRLWQKCIDWSWKEFDAIYKTLGVSFTENDGRGYGESFFEDKMTPVIQELDGKGLLKDSEGAKLIFFDNDIYPPLMIVKKDGATLYATRDLATDKFRLSHYGNDVVVINEVGAEQSLYFQQLYTVEQLLGWYKTTQRVHVKHGLYRFKDTKMSTRKGNTIWLEDVLTEAITRASELSTSEDAQNAQVVAVGALKWNDLKKSSQQDIVFDWDDLLTMEGNSGPYMQYTYARCRSVIARKESATDAAISKPDNWTTGQPDHLNTEELSLLRYLYRFTEVVEDAARTYSPHIVATYLYDLAQRYNVFYHKHSILQPTTHNPQLTTKFRVQLTKSVAHTLKKGLNLLGIDTVEKM